MSIAIVYHVYIQDHGGPYFRLCRTFASSDRANNAAWQWMYRKLRRLRNRQQHPVEDTLWLEDREYTERHNGRCIRYYCPKLKMWACTSEGVVYL